MAKFAPVCPAHIAKGLAGFYALGDYHLLLAHDILQKPDLYHEVFHPQGGMVGSATLGYHETVILDNSVIELGTAVDIEVIVQAATVVKANVIVLPDVLLDAKATVEACRRAADDWEPILRKELGEWHNHDWSYMFVPQGLSREEFAWCAEQFADDGRIGWWGIPRNYSIKGLGSRRDAVEICSALNGSKKIHLLGFGDDIVDDVLSARHPKVNGIDSAVPLRAASAGMKMSMYLPDLGPRKDWWDTVEWDYDMVAAVNLFRTWIGSRNDWY